MLLTTEQVEELTGYKQTAAQVRWLTRNRIRHYVNGQNKVKVMEHEVNNPKKDTQEPDFSHVA